jgi:hypothetical protein
MADADMTRHEVLAKAAYVAPAILTLPVLLSFASAGSGHPGDHVEPDQDEDDEQDHDTWSHARGDRRRRGRRPRKLSGWAERRD